VTYTRCIKLQQLFFGVTINIRKVHLSFGKIMPEDDSEAAKKRKARRDFLEKSFGIGRGKLTSFTEADRGEDLEL
jgi:hypothetical protein